MTRAVDLRSDVDLATATSTDPQAFGELYRRHERAVLAYFMHWTRSPEVAADLAAETFATALGSIETYQAHRGELRGWLFGIARHVLARSLERGRVDDEVRRRLGISPVVLDDDTLDRIESIASLDGAALRLLGDLPGPIRAAVFGRVIQEREYMELAQALQCSPNLVRQRVRRGLARLRVRLETHQ